MCYLPAVGREAIALVFLVAPVRGKALEALIWSLHRAARHFRLTLVNCSGQEGFSKVNLLAALGGRALQACTSMPQLGGSIAS